jgi:hypothetical protein
MATKREMLEEAIADAKAVKEMAIANAKAALEEAFTPQLNNLFSLKLQEMDTEESEKEESEELEEMMDKDTMDEVDLEELLAELNEEESEEEESEESEESEEEKSEEEPIGDLTREELEKMIEDILAEEFPELLNKEEGPEAEESEEEESEEDIELAEILAEIEAMDKEEMEDESMMYEEEELEEDYGNIAVSMSEFLPAILAAFGVVGAAAASTIAQIKKAKNKEEVKNIIDKAKAETKPEVSEEELAEAHSTIESLRKDLNEVNLLNAKLLYTNKIFKAKNLTESQKLKVLGSFDKATNVSEVKLVFETLNEGLKVKKDTIKENIGRASKTTNTPIVKQPIVESNDVFKRMQKLAGLI